MNILVLSWRDPKHPLAGGAEQVVHEHCKGWIKAGHKVTVFSSDFGGSREEILDDVHILRKGSQLLGVQVAAFFWYLFNKKQTFNLVIDSFHGIPFFTPFYVRVKKLVLIQEVAKEVWFLNHLPKPLNFIIGIIGFLTEPLSFSFYKKIPFMTGSNSCKDDLIKMGIPQKNITVVPHGVIIPKVKIYPKEKTKTIIFLGALATDKGIEDAIKTFAILAKCGKFNYWVVGKGSDEYLRYLESLAEKLNINVRFWGFVSQIKKCELLSKAHVLINPSIREGWGLVNIEANSMGTPVIAYNSPGLVDSVKENTNGIICKDNNPECLAMNVLDILSNTEKYKYLQKESVLWSKNFSWESSKKISLELINTISAK